MTSARTRRRMLVGLSVAAAASIFGTTAFAAPPPELPPISQGLAELLAGVPFVSETVLVHGADAERAERAVAESGMRRITTFEKVGIVVAEADATQMQSARAQPGVTFMEASKEIEFATDTSHEATRGRETTKIYQGANGEQLDGTGVTIAIIDSGIDPTHPSFAGGKIVGNLVCNPTPLAACTEQGDARTETLGHGMHVAGVAAGREVELADGTTVAGAAPGATIVALAINQGRAYIAAMTALNWVLEHHAAPCGEGVSKDDCPPIRVTNNSYGVPGGGRFDPNETEAKLQRALVEEGVISVWAAGNSGGDGSVVRTNPPGQDPTPGIVSAAAFTDYETGQRDDPEQTNLTDFSSRGLATDPSTWPDIAAPGDDILSSCRVDLPTCQRGHDPLENGDFTELDGTSFAAPHVAGAVAQLFQLKPFASPADIEDALKDGAFKFDDPGEHPYTRVDSYSSSFDKGTGLVDVLRSADAVQPE